MANLTKEQKFILSYGMTDIIKKWYENPENMAKFEAWMKKKELKEGT